MTTAREPAGRSDHPTPTHAWSAGAFVYSGRPDPVWEVDPAAGEMIARRAAALAPVEQTPKKEAAALRYRGAWLRNAEGRMWHAAGGIVVEEGVGRDDPDRTVERAILATAPEGLLPDWTCAD